MYSDASVRNGKTGFGYDVRTRMDNGEVDTLEKGHKTIEREMGSVEAEYRALIYAIEKASQYRGDTLMAYTDCQSVVHDVHGSITEPRMNLFNRFGEVVEGFDWWYTYWIPSEQNESAHTQSRMATGSWA